MDAKTLSIWRAPVIVGALTAALAGWLFDSAPLALVVLPVAVVVALVVIAIAEPLFSVSTEPEKDVAENEAPTPVGRPSGSGRAAALEQSYEPSMFDVPRLMQAGQWDAARMAMQKIAYTINGQPPDVQEAFKKLMTEFAAQDPLLRTGLAAVLPAVMSQPGQKQTALYPLLAPLTTEEARYVLYFAAELGFLRRVKKGNSYLVYPADHPLPEVRSP